MQSKALLMAKESGLDVAVHPDVLAGLAEREHLQHSIGPTGLLALRPLQVTSYRDDWHRHMIAEATASTGQGTAFARWRRWSAGK